MNIHFVIESRESKSKVTIYLSIDSSKGESITSLTLSHLAGLDSTTAVTVIEALKGIAVNRNSTLIVTIHQPSAKLYGMFDKCLFLSGK